MADCGCDSIKEKIDLVPYDEALEKLLKFASSVQQPKT